jgi:hypothetical protein
MKSILFKLTLTLSLIFGYSLSAYAINQQVGNMGNQGIYAEDEDPCLVPEETDGFESGDVSAWSATDFEADCDEEEVPAEEAGPGWVRFIRLN